MELQKTILEQYMLLHEQPTYKKIAKDTGIQMTRVFRIFNGSVMKLSEFQIFQQKVKCKMGLTNSLEELAFNCSMNLNQAAIKELETLLKRKIATWKLVKDTNKNKASVDQITA